MGTAKPSTSRRAFVLRVLAGPAAFAAVLAVPLTGLAPEAHVALGGYAWIVAWWVTTPVPWGVTSFLPFVLLPIGAEMRLTEVAATYGHVIVPYLIGVMLFGHAFQKHGLARRIALAALCVPGVARSGSGLIFAILVVSAAMSTVFSDLAVIVMMTPIVLSLTRYVAPGAKRMSAAASLAVLYGAAAGALATPTGIVFNALTLSLLDQLTGYSVSFAQWVSTGVILAVAHFPVCYLILKVMLPPEVQAIPNAHARFLKEREQLGPMSRGERNVLFVLILMLALWTLPTVAEIEFLEIWYVPPVAMVLLFVLPVDVKRGEMTLETRDFQQGVGWNVLFLVLGGMAAGGRIGHSGRHRLARRQADGPRHRRGVALGRGSGHATSDAVGQRSGNVNHGFHDSLSDCRRSRLQPHDSGPDYRGHGPGGGISLVQSGRGRNLRVRRRWIRNDVQNRPRRHHPDVDRRDRAEHDPGTGDASIFCGVTDSSRLGRRTRAQPA